MDTTAHRIIKNARDLLVDGLVIGGHGHGMNEDQKTDLAAVTRLLWGLLDNDPAPPMCENCATPLIQPATGRPRRYCSDACRQQDARARG